MRVPRFSIFYMSLCWLAAPGFAQEEPKAKPEGAVGDGDLHDLSLKLEKGDSRKLTVSSELRYTMIMRLDPLPGEEKTKPKASLMGMDDGWTAEFTVKDVDDEGNYAVDIVAERMTARINTIQKILTTRTLSKVESLALPLAR